MRPQTPNEKDSIEIRPSISLLICAKPQCYLFRYARGAMKENAEVSLTPSQVENLLGLLEQEQFWTLTPGEAESAIGQDGSSWFIEGVRTNHYHIAERWMPKEDTPVGRIGRHMVELAEWKIGDLY